MKKNIRFGWDIRRNRPTARINKLESIYENFLSQLSGGKIDIVSEKNIKEKVKQTIETEKIEKQIEKLTAKMDAEKQFNRQIEIKSQIKQLQQQIKDLNNG